MILKMTKNKTGKSSELEKYLKQEEKTEELLMTSKDCDIENFARDFQMARAIHNKVGGRQHYHLVQSFSPEAQITPEQAHELGLRTIEDKFFKGHQIAVITHIDKEHIHNHIVFNATSLETGRKHQSKKIDLEQLIKNTRELCRQQDKEKNIKVDFEKSEQAKLTNGEYWIKQRGQETWKDKLRKVVLEEKEKSSDFMELEIKLKVWHKIEIKVQNKNIKFKYPGQEKFCRGSRLGQEFEKEIFEDYFKDKQRMIELEKQREMEEELEKQRELEEKRQKEQEKKEKEKELLKSLIVLENSKGEKVYIAEKNGVVNASKKIDVFEAHPLSRFKYKNIKEALIKQEKKGFSVVENKYNNRLENILKIESRVKMKLKNKVTDVVLYLEENLFTGETKREVRVSEYKDLDKAPLKDIRPYKTLKSAIVDLVSKKYIVEEENKIIKLENNIDIESIKDYAKLNNYSLNQLNQGFELKNGNEKMIIKDNKIEIDFKHDLAFNKTLQEKVRQQKKEQDLDLGLDL